MPTPAEHYREAEKLLAEAAEAADRDAAPAYLAVLVTAAQVHATLATATEAAGGARLLEIAEEES